MNPIAKLIVLALAAIAGITSFVYLLHWNWRVALAIFVMIWANNISTRKD